MGKEKKTKKDQHEDNTLATNRKAHRDYLIIEKIETGIVLQGTEVKSLRNHRGNLNDAFAVFRGDELYLQGLHISPYDFGNIHNHDPIRTRKLLLHRKELNRLLGFVQQKSYTLIPLTLYLKRGKVKVSLAVGKGKQQYDKRQDIIKRDTNREAQAVLKKYR